MVTSEEIPNRTQVLQPARRPWVGVLLACLALEGASIACVTKLTGWLEQLLLWSGIVFWFPFLIVATLQLLSSASALRLGPEGFFVRNLFRERYTPWARVQGRFTVTKMNLLSQPELVVYKDLDLPGNWLPVFAFANANTALPKVRGLPPQNLAALMNAWKDEATAKAGAQRPP